jgi:hypothetical protein
MAESVKVLPDDIQSLIDVREWDMRTREGIQRFRELKAKSLPSVALFPCRRSCVLRFVADTRKKMKTDLPKQGGYMLSGA